MTQSGNIRHVSAHRAGPFETLEGAQPEPAESIFANLLAWGRKHRVVLAGLAFITAQIGWKVAYLSGLYFRQDDYVDLDIALKSSFDWHYLTLVGSGHLYPGLRSSQNLPLRLAP